VTEPDTSDGIVLSAMSRAMAKSVLAGVPLEGDTWAPDYPLADEYDAVRSFLSQEDGNPESAVFGLYVIRDAVSGVAIGGIGFFGAPDAHGVVEIGYGIVPSMRRRGRATAAVRRVLRIAAEHGATVVRADTTPQNHASIGVMRRAGMTEWRRSDELVFFERRLTGPRGQDDQTGGAP